MFRSLIFNVVINRVSQVYRLTVSFFLCPIYSLHCFSFPDFFSIICIFLGLRFAPIIDLLTISLWHISLCIAPLVASLMGTLEFRR